MMGLLATVVFGSSIASYIMESRAIRSLVQNQMETVCGATVHQIETWVETQANNVAMLAGSQAAIEALKPGDEGSPARAELREDMLRLQKQAGFLEMLCLIDAQG